MTTIASLAVFFVTTRLVIHCAPSRRRVDGVEVDAQARRDGGTQQPPDHINATNGKQRRSHRRSCAWALTTGRARRGDSRDNSATVMHVVKPQHSKLTTSKSGFTESGGLL